MVCTAPDCNAEIWRQRRAETDAAADEAGWRFACDGKAPLLSTRVALCPRHVAAGEEKNFAPAKARK
jgi:hypothetical protein